MKILVISSCTGDKKCKPAKQLRQEDFISPERLRQRTEELSDDKAPAAEMYTGQQHRYLMEGLEQIREIYGQAVVDLHIISAGYGLLRECDVIVPYNVTFTGLKKRQLLARSDSLQIPERVGTLIANYELVFFLLGKEYVQALQLPFQVSDTVTQIFLPGKSYRCLIPDFRNVHGVLAGAELVNEIEGATNYNLKGLLFKKLCETACREGLQVFKEVRCNPCMIRDIALGNR